MCEAALRDLQARLKQAPGNANSCYDGYEEGVQRLEEVIKEIKSGVYDDKLRSPVLYISRLATLSSSPLTSDSLFLSPYQQLSLPLPLPLLTTPRPRACPPSHKRARGLSEWSAAVRSPKDVT